MSKFNSDDVWRSPLDIHLMFGHKMNFSQRAFPCMSNLTSASRLLPFSVPFMSTAILLWKKCLMDFLLCRTVDVDLINCEDVTKDDHNIWRGRANFILEIATFNWGFISVAGKGIECGIIGMFPNGKWKWKMEMENGNGKVSLVKRIGWWEWWEWSKRDRNELLRLRQLVTQPTDTFKGIFLQNIKFSSYCFK